MVQRRYLLFLDGIQPALSPVLLQNSNSNEVSHALPYLALSALALQPGHMQLAPHAPERN